MRIVHVGLPNSIHLARWIDTMAGLDWEHHVIPVNTMAPCDELRNVTVHYPDPGHDLPFATRPDVEIVRVPTRLEGVFPPATTVTSVPIPPARVLLETIRRLAPDVVHAHGIQLAGYPIMDARTAFRGPFPPWIVSCWGSDIFHFGTEPGHAEQITAVLRSANYFVADSQRDIDLARAYGLRGETFWIPTIAGGMDLDDVARYRQPGLTSARRTIAVKGRHTWVYRGLVAMAALERCADLLQGYRVVVYSDHEGTSSEAANRLARIPGVEVEMWSHVSYEQILRMHGSARISISLSVSDGTNLSFLEAMTMGSFPIQSVQSAATEWATDGETALFMDAEDVDGAAAAIRRALTDDHLVDRAAEINARAVAEHLEMASMRARLVELYERAAERGSFTGAVPPRAHTDRAREKNAATGPRAAPTETLEAPGTAPGGHGRLAGDDTEQPPRVRVADATSPAPDERSGLPLVTIITPTYNRATMLPETIESILSQDYPNLEYIVLDDGSTDDTATLLRGYGDAIRWEHHPNMGQPKTVNRGLELARGEILGIVNSDDPLLPGAISALVEAFQEHPDVLLVYPDWNAIDEHGNLLYNVPTFDYSYLDMVRWHHTFPGPCTLFRRSVVDQIGGYDPSFRYVPDYDFFLRAGLLGPFRRVPETLATYRVHAQTITSAERGVAMGHEHIRVTERLYARTDLPPEVLAVKTEAYRNAFYVAGIVCRADTPTDEDERFQITDTLLPRRIVLPAPMQTGSAPDEPAQTQTDALQAHTSPARPHNRDIPTRNLITLAYDGLSASRIGRIKHAVPLKWRVSTRRWLSRAGR